MQDTESSGQERTDHSPTSIAAIEHQHLGTDSVQCQICKQTLREGDTVTVYAFRAAGTPQFDIGYVMCGGDIHHHPTEVMRGVHELIVTGRIGRCTDVATQQSWLTLLAPTLRKESLAHSRRLRSSTDVPTHHTCRPTHPPLSPPDAETDAHTGSNKGSDQPAPPLSTCPTCGAVGFPERLTLHDCPAPIHRRTTND